MTRDEILNPLNSSQVLLYLYCNNRRRRGNRHHEERQRRSYPGKIKKTGLLRRINILLTMTGTQHRHNEERSDVVIQELSFPHRRESIYKLDGDAGARHDEVWSDQ